MNPIPSSQLPAANSGLGFNPTGAQVLRDRQEKLGDLQPPPGSALDKWRHGETPASSDFHATVEFCRDARPPRLDLVRAIQLDHPDFCGFLQNEFVALDEVIYHRIACDFSTRVSNGNYLDIANALGRPGCSIRSLELLMSDWERWTHDQVRPAAIYEALKDSGITSLILRGSRIGIADPVVLPTNLESLTIEAATYGSFNARHCAEIVTQPGCRHLTLKVNYLDDWTDGIHMAGRQCCVDVLDLTNCRVHDKELANLLRSAHSVSELRLPAKCKEELMSLPVLDALKANTSVLAIRFAGEDERDAQHPEFIRLCLDRNQKMANAAVRAGAGVHAGRGPVEGKVLEAFGSWLAAKGVTNHHDYAGLIQAGARTWVETGEPGERQTSVERAREASGAIAASHARKIDEAFGEEKQRHFVLACAAVKKYAAESASSTPHGARHIVREHCPTVTRTQYKIIEDLYMDITRQRMQTAWASMIEDDDET